MAYHWSIHQLTEYFEAVGRPKDEAQAIEVAVERAAEALDAEVGAVVDSEEVIGCIGFGDAVPSPQLIAASQGQPLVDFGALGMLFAVSAGLGSELPATLVVARLSDDFTAEERQMLKGMARVLGLALRNLRALRAERDLRTEREREAERRLVLLDSLGRRQRLLETLLTIQRAISHRLPLQQVLDSVTAGASRLLDDAFVALVLQDPLGGDQPVVPSACPPAGTAGHSPSIVAAAVQAMGANAPITSVAGNARGSDAETVVAAPVHVEGNTVGSLVTLVGVDPLDVEERLELLTVFAEQASLALTDARTLAEMREAYHDSLTGLPNRKLFLDRLENAFELASLTGAGVTVLFIDLDRFKSVNDSLGHAVGDQLLAEVAQRIRRSLRPTDTAARLGGDEFAVLLEDADDGRGGLALANRILQALREPVRVTGRVVRTSASIGIASRGAAVEQAGDLLRNADLAMYRAKKDGRGQAVVFASQMNAENASTLELEVDLVDAVAAGALTVHYQPLISLSTGAVEGVEALLRWAHPTRGNISPLTLIPIAEHIGLMDQIGLFVLGASAQEVARWRADFFPTLRLNVNVSAKQLDNPDFACDVARVLRDVGLPTAAVTLEVTETALMREPEKLVGRLTELKNIGVTISIDDFGTGYSSLASLSRLPVDQVKLDKSFIDNIVTKPRDRAIVRSIIDLADSLGLSTVAEGIEYEAQAAMLSDLHCQLGQGFLLARPMEAAAAAIFLQVNYSGGGGATHGESAEGGALTLRRQR